MEMTFKVESEKLVELQNLIKKHGGRFKHNPFELWGKHHVTLTFDDVHNANKFNADMVSSGI